MANLLENLKENNKQWVEKMLEEDSAYFDKLASGQKPPVLWIGCADSRVPANEITGTGPGDLFVHRNVANLVVPNDVNLLSVLEYAVHHLKVSHIIVCGHYGCGGVQAAMGNSDLGVINNWIKYIKDVFVDNKEELEKIKDDKKRFDKLVELNVKAQVNALAQTSIVQKAWKVKDRKLDIKSWVFDLSSGKIKDLDHTLSEATNLESIYQFKL